MVKTNILHMPASEVIEMCLEIYDSEPKHDPKKLTSNKAVELVAEDALPKEYSSGNLVDLNLGELLSMGVVSTYLNDISKNTIEYPVVVGIGDSDKKAYTEVVLSDGALKDTAGSTGAMPFQQVMAQGYYPEKKVISAKDINLMIDKKVARRNTYPDNCGLVINVYSEDADIDFMEIIKNSGLDKFQLVLIILYHMPTLDRCMVFRPQPGMSSKTLHLNSRKYILRSIE